MMYSEQQAEHLQTEAHETNAGLQKLLLECVRQATFVTKPQVREHLNHGVGRRIGVLRKAIQNIFRAFPLSTTRPLSRDDLSDVQINLHAFVINLSGVFDNWAWAFVFKHGLETRLTNKQSVGMFSNATQSYLPDPIKEYLNTAISIRWYEQYLKNYRDALAHRIPLYIPPAVFTDVEATRHNALESEKFECINSMKWERLDQIYEEQNTLGRPSFAFLHSFSTDEVPKRILIHPQLLSDAKLIVEFGTLFFQYWDKVATPDP